MLTGWCMDCGLCYASFEDWLDHRDTHPPGPRGGWRPVQPNRDHETRAWRMATEEERRPRAPVELAEFR
jgi:hypothetical protein